MKNKILIIEDDPFTQQFYQYLFTKAEIDNVVTEEGDEIIPFLESGDFSLVILDINLKNTYIDKIKVDGIEISRKIKQNKKTSTIPILLISAYQKNTMGRNYFEKLKFRLHVWLEEYHDLI